MSRNCWGRCSLTAEQPQHHLSQPMWSEVLVLSRGWPGPQGCSDAVVAQWFVELWWYYRRCPLEGLCVPGDQGSVLVPCLLSQTEALCSLAGGKLANLGLGLGFCRAAGCPLTAILARSSSPPPPFRAYRSTTNAVLSSW